MNGSRDFHTKWGKSDRERQISYHFYVESKNYTNKLIYKTETDLQISKSNLWLPKGNFGGSDISGLTYTHYYTENIIINKGLL